MRRDQRNIVQCPVCEGGVVGYDGLRGATVCDGCGIQFDTKAIYAALEPRPYNGAQMTELLEKLLREGKAK